jgi:cobaltochelatase CobS
MPNPLMPQDSAAAPHTNNHLVAVDTQKLFGFSVPFAVQGFAVANDWVPPIDTAYHFDPTTTLAILAGFSAGRRVLLQGAHGTGKSSHLEQVAARLNWPLLRINLDSQISRLDLLGRDAIVLRDGLQVTEFQEGLLPWALRHGVALVFDEYDAGRPDVMFVIQRLLETDGKLTLLDANRVITPHPHFRLFATANTLGLGDAQGVYQGTQLLNHAQLDRWHLIACLRYMDPVAEAALLAAKIPALAQAPYAEQLPRMSRLAELSRHAFGNGDLAVVLSPRTLLSWAENWLICGDLALAFRLSYLNRCDPNDHPIIAEFYQRCFGVELSHA